MKPTTEETLIREVQAGDTEAFGALYDLHKHAVYDYCRKLLLNEAEAEDAAQEAFVRAFENITTLDTPSSFRYWLYAIVRNEVYGRIRRRNGRINIPLDDAEETVWKGDDPHTVVVQNETAANLRALIDAMKPEYREALLLREYQEMTYAEIAAITGTSEAAIKARLFKARRALARKLQSTDHA